LRTAVLKRGSSCCCQDGGVKLTFDTLKDMPLTRLADLYRVGGSASSSSTQQLPVQVISVSEEQIKAAEEMVCEAHACVDALMAHVEALEEEQLNRGEPKLPTFVVSRGDDGCAHKVVPDHLTERPSSWKTDCGWAHGNAHLVCRTDVDDLPAERRCEKCASRFSLGLLTWRCWGKQKKPVYLIWSCRRWLFNTLL